MKQYSVHLQSIVNAGAYIQVVSFNCGGLHEGIKVISIYQNYQNKWSQDYDILASSSAIKMLDMKTFILWALKICINENFPLDDMTQARKDSGGV